MTSKTNLCALDMKIDIEFGVLEAGQLSERTEEKNSNRTQEGRTGLELKVK